MDWLNMLEPVAGTEFATANKPKASAQEKFVAALNEQIKLAQGGESDASPTFIVQGDRAAFGVKYGNTYLKLRGDETRFVVDLDQLALVLEAIRDDALAGKFNDQLAAIRQSFVDRVQSKSKTAEAAA